MPFGDLVLGLIVIVLTFALGTAYLSFAGLRYSRTHEWLREQVPNLMVRIGLSKPRTEIEMENQLEGKAKRIIAGSRKATALIAAVAFYAVSAFFTVMLLIEVFGR